jgi:hypothetical protein
MINKNPFRQAYEDKETSEALLADGFEDALLGFGRQCNRDVAVYDTDRCLGILQSRDDMSEEDALEYFEFNVAGAWVGPNTPIFMSLAEDSTDVSGRED